MAPRPSSGGPGEPRPPHLNEIFHVQPKGAIWQVYQLFSMASQLFITEDEAVAYATHQAEAMRPSEVVLHAEDGAEVRRVRYE